MKRYFQFIIVFFAYGCVNSQTEAAFNYQDFEKYSISAAQADSIFDSVKKFPNETQLSIALIKNGVPKFYGIHRVNDSLKSTDNSDGVFEIGSISKVFTSTLLAGLVLESKIANLNDNLLLI